MFKVEGSNQFAYNRVITISNPKRYVKPQLEEILTSDVKEMLIARGEMVSDKKMDILKTKGNPRKEKLLMLISKYFHKKYIKDKNTITYAKEIEIRDKDFVGVVVQFSDTMGMGTDPIKKYYTSYANNTLKKLKMSHKELDRGIDDTGNAYVVVRIDDNNFIKELILEFKLNEHFNLTNKKNLSNLFESVKRTKT